MTTTNEVIIPNVIDHEGENVSLKVVFKENTPDRGIEYNKYIMSAEAFDSKGRYFATNSLFGDKKYYEKDFKFNVIYKSDYKFESDEKVIELYLDGEGWAKEPLVEDDTNDNHIKYIEEKIRKTEEQLKILKEKRDNIKLSVDF